MPERKRLFSIDPFPYGKLQICWQQWPWLSVWRQQQSLVSLFRPKWGWTIYLNYLGFTWTISRCLDKVNSLLDVDMDKAPTLTELGHFYSQFGNWLFLMLRELKIWLMKITIMAKWHNLPVILQGKCPGSRNYCSRWTWCWRLCSRFPWCWSRWW